MTARRGGKGKAKVKHIGTGTMLFGKRLRTLFHQPVFLVLTLWGAASIIGGTMAFYAYEHGANPHVNTVLDALLWSVSTVTTVGPAEIFPATNAGKWISMVMMVLGSLFLWSYAAMFAAALVAPELTEVEEEITELEQEVEREIRLDKRSSMQLVSEIEKLLEELKRRS